MNGRRANGLGGEFENPRANSARGAPCGAEGARQKTVADARGGFGWEVGSENMNGKAGLKNPVPNRGRGKPTPLLAIGVAILFAATLRAGAAKPDAEASRAAFMQVYRVLISPRCQNCHPAGDAPLQGDDSHVHTQNVKRGGTGHGVYGMSCNTCHQTANLAGAHMPPGNPKWALPPAGMKMVFQGKSAAELCRDIKDTKLNGGRSLEALVSHIANDDLVGWGWDPGEGRTLPPLTRGETVGQLRIWIEGGAACPQ